MVHFMSSADGSQINGVAVSEHFEALMNENIMYQEIRYSIKCDAQSNPEAHTQSAFIAIINANYARYCKYEKEKVVLLKKVPVMPAVMIMVKRPQKTVHNILMRCPRNTLHTNKGNNDNR